MEFRRDRNEALADDLRRFIDESYPDHLRRRRFEWPFDWQFHQALRAWQDEHLSEPDSATVLTFAEELDSAEIELRTSQPTTLVAGILAEVGTDEQRRDLVPRFISGHALACLGYTEPDSGSDVAAAKTRAVRDGDEWVINGQKMFTTNAEIATHVLLLTRTNDEVPKHKGLTMFVVPLDTPGVEVRPLQTLRGHQTNMTFYTDVHVPDAARVGDVDGGWSVMRVALDIEHGAGPMRAARQVASAISHGLRMRSAYERTVSWARNARRPDGTAVLDDPSTRERLARIAVEAEVAFLLENRNDSSRSSPGVGNGSKLYASEAFVRSSADQLDLAGSEGLINCADPHSVGNGWIEYAFRDAPVSTIAGGSSEVQRDIIAERRLGLTPSRSRNR